jgi:alcohol dehydrogenase class IV
MTGRSFPSFYLPTQLITGLGCSGQLGQETCRLGTRALFVCSQGAAARGRTVESLLASLEAAGIEATLFAELEGEPTLALVEDGIRLCRQAGCDVVVGLGGGSPMDAAKAVAGLVRQPGSVADYHRGWPLEAPALPLITIPTTAGSGAEVTRNAVLSDPGRRVKASIRGPDWYARIALIDPLLTAPVPAEVTAASGGDALCQAIEAFVSIGASPATDALAGEAVRLVGRSLVPAFRDGAELAARSDMLYGSLLAGMALVNARLGAVHGMAHPLGLRFDIPHGTVCGLLLPHVMAYNLPWAEEKYAQVARWLGVEPAGQSEAELARRSVEAVQQRLEQIDLPLRLRHFGVTETDLPIIVEESLPSGSLKHNPRPLDAADVSAILSAAL